MIIHYFTLEALADLWNEGFAGGTLAEVYSQAKDELTLIILDGGAPSTFRLSVAPSFRFIFRTDGHSKARTNVADLYDQLHGQTLTGIRVADRDRFMFFDMSDGSSIQFIPFGPRPNVHLVGPGQTIVSSFKEGASWKGKEPPSPRPAVEVKDFATFLERWQPSRKSTLQALTASIPLMDQVLAREILHRSGIEQSNPALCDESDLRNLYLFSRRLLHELRNEISPRIYWSNGIPRQLALSKLHHLEQLEEEVFDDLEDAVRVFARRTLSAKHFQASFDPIEKAVSNATRRLEHRKEHLEKELKEQDRADNYEKWGHLLMASPTRKLTGSEILLPDIFSEGDPVKVPVRDDLTLIENAELFYEKARKSRDARDYAVSRWRDMETNLQTGRRLLRRLEEISTLTELESFRKDEAAALDKFLPDEMEANGRLPFRQFVLRDGSEVLVGKNASQNDLLTFKHASKHDFWMHARGVPGSHVILRRPNRSNRPARHILEEAAAIAAYYSEARKSSLVPVQVTERKYVRKAKGAPGKVKLEREDVILAEPRIPQETGS